MKLSEIAKEIEGATLVKDAEIGGLCTDSRVAEAGDLFFCYRGENADLHEFAAEADERGASVVCERRLETSGGQLIVPDGRLAMAKCAAAYYRHPERHLSFVGVTGTNGKTTVSHMLYSVLTEAGIAAGLIGTLGARYAATALSPSLTTPDPVPFYSLLSDMVGSGVQTVVMEVSAHALALRKIDVTFDVAIFTNLTQDHLDFFHDMRAYGEAKKQLFLPTRSKFAVLNADDGFCRDLQAVCAEHTTYGLDTPADCFALVERETLKGTLVLLNIEDDLIDVQLHMTGRHNVYNALAAATAARRLGISSAAIAKGIAKTQVEGRLERVGSFRGAEIFVDFAHTPDGLEKSLDALRTHCKGRLVVLFGCGGNRDKSKRPRMGEVAAKHADFAVITSDNPRYEDPVAIISEIEAGFSKFSDRYIAVEERERATEFAVTHLDKGDILLIAGKGGEHTQEIMGIKYSYNDKDVVRTVLEKAK